MTELSERVMVKIINEEAYSIPQITGAFCFAIYQADLIYGSADEAWKECLLSGFSKALFTAKADGIKAVIKND